MKPFLFLSILCAALAHRPVGNPQKTPLFTANTFNNTPDTVPRPKDSLIAGAGAKLEQVGSQIKVATNSPVFTSVSKLKSITATSLDTGTVYFLNTADVLVPYKWNPAGTNDDDSVTVIQRTGTAKGRFELYYETYILANWFGLDPTGKRDCSRQMQKAIDFAIANQKTPYLRILGGIYKVKDLMLYQKSGGEYNFVTATIEGSAPAYDETLGLGHITILKTNDSSAFTLGVQKGRNVHIKNISFVGPTTPPASVKQTVEWTDAQWARGVSNNLFSPAAAIVIDPFHAQVKSGDRYKGMSSWYSNNDANGSSEIHIEGVNIRNYIVGVAASLSGATQNGDNITWVDGSAQGVQVLWAAGQSQTRDNAMTNIYTTGGIQFIVNCSMFGAGLGSAPHILNCSFAGGTKYIHHLNGDFGGMQIDNTHFESLWSLGKSGVMPVTYKGCEIKPSLYDVDKVFAPAVFAEGYHYNFIGGSLDFFDGAGAMGFQFNAAQAKFDGVKIRGTLPTNSNQYNQNNFQFDNVQYFNPDGLVSALYQRNNLSGVNVSQLTGKAVFPGTVIDAEYSPQIEITGNKLEFIGNEKKAFTINAALHTGYFRSSSPAMYKVHDVVAVMEVVNDAGDIFGESRTLAGQVTAVSGDTVKLKYVSDALVTGTSYTFSIIRVPRFVPRTIGNLASGSDTIRNVKYFSSSFAVGARIKGNGIPVGTRVTYVNLAAGKIAINQRATATAAKVELYDATYKQTGAAAGPSSLTASQVFFTGDVINKSPLNAADSVYQWVCIQPGQIGVDEPVFGVVRFGSAAGANNIPSRLYKIEQADSVITRDAKRTTVATIAIPEHTNGTISFEINANTTGATGAASYSYKVRYKKSGGTLTLFTARAVVPDDEDAALSACSVSVGASGNNVVIQVNGVAGTAVKWNCVMQASVNYAVTR